MRETIEASPQWSKLDPYLKLVEENLESSPQAALDGAKSLVEAVAKTILVDRGTIIDSGWSLEKLAKEACRALPVTMEMDGLDAKATIRLVSGTGSISAAVGSLRNRHGVIGHGRDIHASGPDFPPQLSRLAIESAEVVACFLVRAHEASVAGVSRVHYEEYAVFNSWLDAQVSLSESSGVSISVSRALFDQDPVAYREKLLEYQSLPLDSELTREEEVDILVNSLEESGSFKSTHEAISDLQKVADFTPAQVARLMGAAMTNSQIYQIAQDQDVDAFFEGIISRYSEVIDADLVKSVRFIFSIGVIKE